MIALNASFSLANQQGIRTVPADEFFLGPFKTALKPDEILTDVQIPITDSKCGGAYQKIKKGSGGFTIAGAAVNLAVAEDCAVSACRIAMTSVGPKPLRALAAEQALIGKKPESSTLDEVAVLAVDASQPASDLTASAEYRRKVLGILMRDAVKSAYKRAVMGKYAKN